MIAIIDDPSTTRRRFSNRVGQTTRLAGPVSSSMVMNITPLGRSRLLPHKD
ncbi:hypothetical protein FHT86_007319 [Rhizobium sp. BK313]|nr:hypothetical protein [Rhizobium sp. BK313]